MPAHRYRFGARIAAGATGEVYRGEFLSEGFSRPVAIKLMRVDVAHQAEVSARLRDEARMVARVRHPSIVRVEDLTTFDGRLAIVMELVDGADLAAIRDRYGRLSPRAVAEILQKVAGALHQAHIAPGPDGTPMAIVHRDIKPENVALDVFGEVKVLDFGAARARFVGREAETRDLVPGTLPYMAPERFLGGDEGGYGTPASDLWALGATAVEAAVGTPWTEIRRAARGSHALTGAVDAMRAAAIPQMLAALLTELLASAPEDRPTAQETARRAGEMASRLPGESLLDLAPRAVEATRGQNTPMDDARRGALLTVSDSDPAPPADQPSSWPAPSAVPGLSTPRAASSLTVVALSAALALIVVLGAGGALAWWMWPEPQAPAASVESERPDARASPDPDPPVPTELDDDAPAAPATHAVAPATHAVAPASSDGAPAPPARPKVADPAPDTVDDVSGAPLKVFIAFDPPEGVVRAWLDPGAIPLPAEVPPGSYVPSAQFADGTHRGSAFTVEEGKPMKVNCYSGTCRARAQ